MFGCPVTATLGALVYILVRTENRYHPQSDHNEIAQVIPVVLIEKTKSEKIYHNIITMCQSLVRHPLWMVSRLAIAAITGLLVALNFAGSLHEDMEVARQVVYKIWFISFFIGFCAPSLWQAKENWVKETLNSKAFKTQLTQLIFQAQEDAKTVRKTDGKEN